MERKYTIVPQEGNMVAMLSSSGELKGTLSSSGSMKATLGSGGTGVKDYELLVNKPSIENVELIGNKLLSDFGMGTADILDIRSLFR